MTAARNEIEEENATSFVTFNTPTMFNSDINKRGLTNTGLEAPIYICLPLLCK